MWSLSSFTSPQEKRPLTVKRKPVHKKRHDDGHLEHHFDHHYLQLATPLAVADPLLAFSP